MIKLKTRRKKSLGIQKDITSTHCFMIKLKTRRKISLGIQKDITSTHCLSSNSSILDKPFTL
jgi:hypothetical protein